MSRTDGERVLDVREVDGPPFDEISTALTDLEDGERLRLIAPFEPRPLYEVLEERGFEYDPERTGDGLFEVLIADSLE
ncbi:DUF2249 domain-containing protein [Natronococcus jeotgali]|uniref:DUF2249 domain-containing protein n=1 Tax=Natronococcus jeotgali DSM 18795 TaxID=1227498 RepID=L9XJ70_9EURY|nr:DUF2249 domain-containing protein [Natronococcus jeotgali]ELY60703.1 hypothetical protein C492_10455 [Natronococcus jeotgali DSM 18795]